MTRTFRRTQQVFHLLIALAFLFLTGAGVEVSLQLWRDYQKTPAGGMWSFGMVVSFTVVLLFFSLYSFLKARSVR